MLHLVVKPYDPSLDYKRYCQLLFGDNRCLAMLEKKGGDHLHIQGECAVGEDRIQEIQKQMIASHYRKKMEPTSRPVKRRKTAADELGFQYMSKELPTSVVVYKQKFTDEELEELYARSNELREELQSKLGEYIYEKCGQKPQFRSPIELHKRVCGYALRYYMDQDKMCPPNIKLLVRHFMLKYYGVIPEVFEYLSELIM